MGLLTKSHLAVTGSTGHLGSVLIPMMLDQGFKLKCLYRKNPLPIKHPNLIWVQGNLMNEESLTSLLKDSQTLIHAASLISVGEDNRKEVFEANVEGTEKLIKKCVSLNVRMVYISSSSAVEVKDPLALLDEHAPRTEKKDFYYGWTKALAEKMVLDAVDRGDLSAFALRPTSLVGPPDFGPSLFGKTIIDMSLGKLPMITSGGYNIVDVRDFSQTIINSLERGESGEIYFTGGRFCSIKELAQLVNPKKIPSLISVDFLIRILPLINFYAQLFPLKWPINRESLITLKNAPRNVDSSKAENRLLHKSRPLNETLNDLLNWVSKNETNGF